jgi:hypothetical protein
MPYFLPNDGGRGITSFLSSGLYETMIAQDIGTTSSTSYRDYLRKDGRKVVDAMRHPLDV